VPTHAVHALLVLVGAAFIYVAVRAVFPNLAKGRHGGDLAAVAGVVLFLLGACLSVTDRAVDRFAGASAPPQAAASQAAALSCPIGAAVAGGADGHIDKITANGADIGADAPLDVAPSTAIHFGGWTTVLKKAASSACVVSDGHIVATTGTYGVARPDVATAFSNASMTATGFDVTAFLPTGQHKVTIAAITPAGPKAIAQMIVVSVH